jgi:hypothetical protein
MASINKGDLKITINENTKSIQVIVEYKSNKQISIAFKNNYWYHICAYPIMNLAINNVIEITEDKIYDYFVYLNSKFPETSSSANSNAFYALIVIKKFIDEYSSNGDVIIASWLLSIWSDTLRRALLESPKDILHVELNNNLILEAQVIPMGLCNFYEVYSYNNFYKTNGLIDVFIHYSVFSSEIVFNKFIKPLHNMKNVDAELLDGYIKAAQDIQVNMLYASKEDSNSPVAYLSELYKKYVCDSERDYTVFINEVLLYKDNADLSSFIDNNA